MIQGRVTNVGTMIVNGEQLTGIFVETTKAALMDTPLPLYQDCFVGWWRPIEGAPSEASIVATQSGEITPTQGWVILFESDSEQRDALANALRKITDRKRRGCQSH